MKLVETAAVRLGVDVLFDESFDLIRGKRVGVVAAAASVDGQLTATVHRLVQAPDVTVVALFGPEHGLYGEVQAGQPISDAVDAETRIPVHSLYGDNKKPTLESLSGLDALVIDLVDAGCRYWTFAYTMAYALQACAEADVHAIVLDRPNPITGVRMEGNILNPKFSSFVGLYPIPMRTGLTLGELALLFNDEFDIGARLSVVPVAGWKRTMWYDETGLPFVPPSPNSPNLDMLTLYPGTCLIEGSNVSEGRGTTRPFEMIGAPWIKPRRLADRLTERRLPGVAFRPIYFTPTFDKYAGETCGGVHVHIVDRDAVHSVRTGLHIIDCIMRDAPSDFEWIIKEGIPIHVDLLAGTDELRLNLGINLGPDELLEIWERELPAFQEIGKKAHLYGLK